MEVETTTFFGRILRVEMACPNCGKIYPFLYSEKNKNAYFDPLRSVFTCIRSNKAGYTDNDGCAKSFYIGLLAYKMTARKGIRGVRATPKDAIPTIEQAAELRRLIGQAQLVKERVTEFNPTVNAVAITECTCLKNPNICQVHFKEDITELLEDNDV